MEGALATTDLESLREYEEAVKQSEHNIAGHLAANLTKEFTVNGMYARALEIPQGCLLTSRVHVAEHIDICVSGDILVKNFYFDGQEDEIRIQGFNFLPAPAGRKRIGIAQAPTLWITVDRVPEGMELQECLDHVMVEQVEDYVKRLNP